jgi:hypothetical protein
VLLGDAMVISVKTATSNPAKNFFIVVDRRFPSLAWRGAGVAISAFTC